MVRYSHAGAGADRNLALQPRLNRGGDRRVELLQQLRFAAIVVVEAVDVPVFPDLDISTANAQPVAVVSNGYWRTRLNSDPSAVGQVAILNGLPVTIIGVAPPEFFGERVRQSPDFWLPFLFQPQIELRETYLERTDTYWLNLMGRLRHGASREQARVAGHHRVATIPDQPGRHAAYPQRKQDIERTYVHLYDGGRGISGQG